MPDKKQEVVELGELTLNLRGKDGLDGLGGKEAEELRVIVSELQTAYGSALKLELKTLVEGFYIMDRAVSTSLNPKLSEAYLIPQFMQVFEAFLSAPIETQEERLALANPMGIVMALMQYSVALCTKQIPVTEYCYRNQATEGTQEWKDGLHDLLVLGNYCVTVASNPTECKYTPLCAAYNFVCNFSGLVCPSIYLNINQLFLPLNNMMGYFQMLNSYSSNLTADSTKSFLDVIETLFKALTGDGEYPLRFRVHATSKQPSIYLPYNLTPIKTLVREGWVGWDMDVCRMVEDDTTRCFSDSSQRDAGWPDPASVVTDTTGVIPSDKDVTYVYAKEVYQRYHNNPMYLEMVKDVMPFCQFKIDPESSQTNLAEHGIAMTISEIDNLTEGDQRLDHLIYTANLHPSLYKVGGGARESLSSFSDHRTKIAGSAYEGPGNVKVQSTADGAPSALGTPMVHPTYGYAVWTDSLINTLNNNGRVGLFSGGMKPGDRVTVIQYMVLLPDEQAKLSWRPLDLGPGPVQTDAGAYMATRDYLESASVSCCAASKAAHALLNPYLAAQLETPPGSTAYVSSSNAAKMDFVGPNLVDQPLLRCPVADKDGTESFTVGGMTTSDNEPITYSGKYINCSGGTIALLVTTFFKDALQAYNPDIYPADNDDETLMNGYLPMAFTYKNRLLDNKPALKGSHQRLADLRCLGAKPSEGDLAGVVVQVMTAAPTGRLFLGP